MAHESASAQLANSAAGIAFWQDNEPQTLQYEILRSDRNPDQVLILERYVSRDYMLEPHKSSPAFQEFKRRLANADILLDKEGSSWLSTAAGIRPRL